MVISVVCPKLLIAQIDGNWAKYCYSEKTVDDRQMPLLQAPSALPARMALSLFPIGDHTKWPRFLPFFSINLFLSSCLTWPCPSNYLIFLRFGPFGGACLVVSVLISLLSLCLISTISFLWQSPLLLLLHVSVAYCLLCFTFELTFIFCWPLLPLLKLSNFNLNT